MTQSAHDCTKRVDIEPISAKAGDEWSPTERAKVACWLVRERWRQYLTIGLLLLGNVEDVEDAFQEFIEKIIKEGFPEFDPRRGYARAYILVAWRNHLKNHFDRTGRRALLEKQMPLDEQGKLLFEAVDGELPVPILVDLRLRLESLPDEQRTVIGQRFLDGKGQLKPFKDIAAETGKTVEAVKKIYQRGMKALRKQADDENEGTVVIESVPLDEGHQKRGSDADTATDRKARQTKSEDLP